ncbi:ATP-binding protein [Marinobacterium jannaschii]|uniref:ATP-binding protein n=1 Tax=Marinobacterium jannaschii TaxID=64970 RepID=UPI00055E0431|nr:ATP-binding protein [Marinobacterium jannaschii]
MANHQNNLLQLSYIRTLTLFGQCIAVLFVLYILQAELDIWLAGATLTMLALLNAATYARLHSPWPVTEPELFTQLVADISLQGALLYQIGGSTNPFIFLLLVPLIIAATTLSRLYVWIISALVVATYSSLLFYYQPIIVITSHQHSMLSLFDLHITGMWLNFLLTVLVVTYFVMRMQGSMQQQRQQLAQEREKRIHDQQLISLATMAAGTAHELGTPLSTMRVLLKEMELDHQDDTQLREDISELQQQVENCARRLQQMTRSVREEQQNRRLLAVDQLLHEVLEQWQLMRPEAQWQLEINNSSEIPKLAATTSLRQALINLLNNAADASPVDIRIKLDWSCSQIILQIHDQGAGLSLETHDNLGKPFVTTKGRGLGIGLFLTSSTLASYDGEVRLYNHQDGGTLTEVTLNRPNAAPQTTAKGATL